MFRPIKLYSYHVPTAFVLFALALVIFNTTLAITSKADDNWNPFLKDDEGPYYSQNDAPQQKIPPLPDKKLSANKNKSLPQYTSSNVDSAFTQSPPLPGINSGYVQRYKNGSSVISTMPSVERGDLAPVMSSASGLPFGLWQGLTASDVEQLVAPLQLPAASASLQKLWLRILTSPDAAESKLKLSQMRAWALFRSGRMRQASHVLRRALAISSDDPNLDFIQASIELALGNQDTGCRSAKRAVKSNLSKFLRAEAIILTGYCVVIAGNKAAANLAAELARNEGYGNRFTLDVLAAIASGRKSRTTLPKVVRVIDYLLLKETGFTQAGIIIPRASPALLQVLMTDAGIPAAIRLHAAEEAAIRNVISGNGLAEAYRRLRDGRKLRHMPADGAIKRAQMFQEAENFPSRLQRTRTIRQLIDEAQREGKGLGFAVMVAVKPIVQQLRPAPEIGWFAMTAIEVMLAAADYDGILPWLALAQAHSDSKSNEHWLTLANIANPASKNQPINLKSLEILMQNGQFRGQMLKRLTTVLDALDYNVPIPIWNASQQITQSDSGKLPPTGILTQLLAASKAGEKARTVLLVLRTLNGSTAMNAHLLALGESIRGLKRVGLEKDARRLAFEAVIASWPRLSE